MDAARAVCLRLNDQLTDCASLQHLSETAERAVETALGVQRCTLLVLQEPDTLQRWSEQRPRRAPTLAPHLCLSLEQAAEDLPPLAGLHLSATMHSHGGIASVDDAALQVATPEDASGLVAAGASAVSLIAGGG